MIFGGSGNDTGVVNAGGTKWKGDDSVVFSGNTGSAGSLGMRGLEGQRA